MNVKKIIIISNHLTLSKINYIDKWENLVFYETVKFGILNLIIVIYLIFVICNL